MKHILFLLLLAPCIVQGATKMPWDTHLEAPPQMSEAELAIANEEALPEFENRTKTVYASEYYGEGDTPQPYGELAVTYRKSRNHKEAPSIIETYLYGEIPLPFDGVSAWGLSYLDKEFREVTVGLAKRFGDLQVALGFGSAWYDGKRHTVINPWVYYSSDIYEAELIVEHYANEAYDPWFYKWSFERKFGDVAFGLYGEKDFGIGPMVTYNVQDALKVKLAIPIADRPSEGQMRFLLGVTYEF